MQAPSSPRFPLQIRPTRGWGGSATQMRTLIKPRIGVADPPHPQVGRICNGDRELDGAPEKRFRFVPPKNTHLRAAARVHTETRVHREKTSVFFRRLHDRSSSLPAEMAASTSGSSTRAPFGRSGVFTMPLPALGAPRQMRRTLLQCVRWWSPVGLGRRM